MSYIVSPVKHLIKALLVFIVVSQPIYANTIDEQREQAKSIYFSGELEPALSSFLKISESGDAESQYYIGLIYLTEHWAKSDVYKGVSYLLSAADQNSTEAMWKLGELYENGQGVKTDLLVALDWYRKSKQLDSVKSNIRFIKVNNGEAVLQSNTDAIKIIEHNALNNSAEAQFKLANIYDEGRLAEKDAAKAFHWYQAAAKNNHSHSMLITGYLLCRGIGVEQNQNKANEWLKKSTRKASCN